MVVERLWRLASRGIDVHPVREGCLEVMPVGARVNHVEVLELWDRYLLAGRFHRDGVVLQQFPFVISHHNCDVDIAVIRGNCEPVSTVEEYVIPSIGLPGVVHCQCIVNHHLVADVVHLRRIEPDVRSIDQHNVYCDVVLVSKLAGWKGVTDRCYRAVPEVDPIGVNQVVEVPVLVVDVDRGDLRLRLILAWRFHAE